MAEIRETTIHSFPQEEKEVEETIQTPTVDENELTESFPIEEHHKSVVELIQERIDALNSEMTEEESRKKEVIDYLESDHLTYKLTKARSIEVQCQILNKEKKEDTRFESSPYMIFDFENNTVFSNSVKDVGTCYKTKTNEVQIAKEDGIYPNLERFGVSRLFFEKDGDISADHHSSVNKLIEKTIDDIDGHQKFSLFAMLPESVDLFNAKVRGHLTTSKGKIISIPKSVAATYSQLHSLDRGTRFAVLDLDGLEPILTQLSIGRNDHGTKVIQREGIIKNTGVKYSYPKFAKSYLDAYAAKYCITFTNEEEGYLIKGKALQNVLTTGNPLTIFRKQIKIIINKDQDLIDKCLTPLISADYQISRCALTLVISSFGKPVTGKTVINLNPESCFQGIEKIRALLLIDPNYIVWREMLPKITLEVIDDEKGIFKKIPLVDSTVGQNINLSLDEEAEISSPGTITLQAGKKEYFLPMEREIYTDDINKDKEAHFMDKSFPLQQDVQVDLVVKYNYMSDSPLKLYARPRTKIPQFYEIANTWEDPHEIKVYQGPIYDGHPVSVKPLRFSDDYIRMKNNLTKFVSGRTEFMLRDSNYFIDFAKRKHHPDARGPMLGFKVHRALFDSTNAKDPAFEKLFASYQVLDYLKAATDAFVDKADDLKRTYGEKNYNWYRSSISENLSDIIVTCWYRAPTSIYVKPLYKWLSETEDFETLSRLSRCILKDEDDIFRVFDKLVDKVYKEVSSCKMHDGSCKMNKPLNRMIRGMSSNCWFTKNWVYMFYNAEHGSEVVHALIEMIERELKDKQYGWLKNYRDLMEFLVCLSRLKDVDNRILNPNDISTKELLEHCKYIFPTEVKRSFDHRDLVSRLESDVSKQGALRGYPNYIYMLIMTLSGEGQVNLVGYHDD